MKKNKIIAALLCIVALGAFGSAAWILGYGPTNATGFVVNSSQTLTYSDSFTMSDNDGMGEKIKVDFLSIENTADAPVDMSIEILTDVVDTDENDSCDISGDVEVRAYYTNSEDADMNLTNGDMITIPASGYASVNVETITVDKACPQTAETTVYLEEILA